MCPMAQEEPQSLKERDSALPAPDKKDSKAQKDSKALDSRGGRLYKLLSAAGKA
jgi:hypothetical protein